ncbi:MAG: hypothetical protein JKY84_01465 [Emcibacteraceae bacterium]|nr:hypothetical protein [Emcibacteraceae bacterium]
MKKLIITITILVFGLITFTNGAIAQDEEYVFRNDIRPEYNKNITVTELNALQSKENITLIDVRLLEDFALDPTLIPDAKYKDPEKITNWSLDLPKDKKVVLYCVKGAWVSHKAATYLNDKGYDVVTLEGGIRAWKKDSSK